VAVSITSRSIAREAPSHGARSLPTSERVRMVEHALESEFGHTLESDVIGRLAVESVEGFDGAPVQSFVPILAVRSARRRARAMVYGDVEERAANAATAAATVSNM
jgi:hypothetical protein